MNRYRVTIKESFIVEAYNEEDAQEKAHEQMMDSEDDFIYHVRKLKSNIDEDEEL